MKKIITLFFLFLISISFSFAMQAPTDNQVFDYSPIAVPVVSNAPDTAFPMGLGSAADDGSELSLRVETDAFNFPVDLYLGLYAPSIVPGELYLFTESGDLQGLNTSGLAAWRKNQTTSFSATVFSDISTDPLPHGTYTFYLMVTPADDLTSFWLWSTPFQHINPVKGIFVNTVKEDDLVLTAVDQNDLYYSWFGEKDEEGKLLHFNRLILDQRTVSGSFEHYMTLDFDSQGRPVTISVPSTNESMSLEYTSETSTRVSITADDGSTDVFTVDNPYPAVRTRKAEPVAALSAENRSGMLRSSVLDNNWFVGGIIRGCKNSKLPQVSVRRKLDKAILESEPQLALIKPKVRPVKDQTNSTDFDYVYYLQGLADYDDWYWSCVWDWVGGDVIDSVTGAIGGIAQELLEAAVKLSKLETAIDTDIKNGTKNKLFRQISDTIGDGILPIWSFSRKLYDTSKLPIDAHNGPCSSRVWRYLNQVQTAEQTVKVTLNGITKQVSFTPKPEQLSQYLTVVDAPVFDFSDSCPKTELSCYSQCTGKVIEIDASCPIPEGAKYSEFIYSEGWNKYYLLNKKQVGLYESWSKRDDGSLYLAYKKCLNEEGQLNGWDIRYNENGSMNMATHYTNDMRDGHQYDFYSEFETGVANAMGSLYVDNTFKNGENTYREAFHEDGAMKMYCNCAENPGGWIWLD